MVSEIGPQMSIAMMSAPSLASRIACALPWPRAAPVMNATRPSRGPPFAVTAAPFREAADKANSRTGTCSSNPSVDGVADQRARHAVAAAAAAAEFGADDGDHLDA